jgi:hypothetical protein
MKSWNETGWFRAVTLPSHWLPGKNCNVLLKWKHRRPKQSYLGKMVIWFIYFPGHTLKCMSFPIRARLAPIIWGWNQRIHLWSCLAATELVTEFIWNSMIFIPCLNINSCLEPCHSLEAFSIQRAYSASRRLSSLEPSSTLGRIRL